MREDTKVRDILKSTFKETPESFRNAVNNAITEAVQLKHRTQKAVKNKRE